MKPITQEWIDKAEGDWLAALQLYRARKHPNYDLACYLAQQSIEKYLKARLKEAGSTFRKTHDLLYLLNLVLRPEPTWRVFQTHVQRLNNYAVDIRYPGKSATKAEAKQAIKDCREVRKAVRTAFGLPV